MAKEVTNTSNSNLPREGHYECATVETCKKKKIKEVYTIYEFGFSTVLNGENYGFVIGLFPSQMDELLKALGAKEVGKNQWEWDTEEVVGMNLSFIISHKADNKGETRAVISDVKSVTVGGQKKTGEEIAWTD